MRYSTSPAEARGFGTAAPRRNHLAGNDTGSVADPR
ncbi:hypothetical protein KIPE111705_38370 [Kibdelosporangium persicum]